VYFHSKFNLIALEKVVLFNKNLLQVARTDLIAKNLNLVGCQKAAGTYVPNLTNRYVCASLCQNVATAVQDTPPHTLFPRRLWHLDLGRDSASRLSHNLSGSPTQTPGYAYGERRASPCTVGPITVPFFYRATHFTAKRGIAWDCMSSVCQTVTLVDEDHIGWKSWQLIAGTISLTPSLFVAQRPFTYSQRNMGKFGETGGGVRKSGVLEHKSGNISETRKDRGKVIMEGL